MYEALAGLLANARLQVLIFLYLIAVLLIPGYATWRVEQAVIALNNKIECGSKIQISSARIPQSKE